MVSLPAGEVSDLRAAVKERDELREQITKVWRNNDRLRDALFVARAALRETMAPGDEAVAAVIDAALGEAP